MQSGFVFGCLYTALTIMDLNLLAITYDLIDPYHRIYHGSLKADQWYK